MPKLKQYPKQCNDRGRAFAWHRGKRIYFGVAGTDEADRNYDRFIRSLTGEPTPSVPNALHGIGDGGITDSGGTGKVLVSELTACYMKHVAPRLDHSHLLHFRYTIGFLVGTYGEIFVNDFSPKKLKLTRLRMIESGRLCRKTVNDYTRRIVQMFSWGCEEEWVEPNVVSALREVKSLRKGEPGTFDNPPRKEVSDDIVRRTLPFMSPTVAAMVQIQRMTGMRPSELCTMTVGDIDKTRDPELWYYVPEKQKTEEHIGKQPIPLGKPEQTLLEPYLKGKKPSAAVFSPSTAMTEWHAERRKNRKTAVPPSQQKREEQRAKKPAERQPGEFYDRNSYRTVVANGSCERRQERKQGSARESKDFEMVAVSIAPRKRNCHRESIRTGQSTSRVATHNREHDEKVCSWSVDYCRGCGTAKGESVCDLPMT